MKRDYLLGGLLLLVVGLTACGGTEDTFDVEELFVTIEAAGTFWEDFWALRGVFAVEHFDDSPWEYWIEQPNHPRSIGFQRVLPSFAFQSLEDITDYLSQFYTDIWIQREFFGDSTALADGEMFFGEPWAFMEYGGYFYVHTARIGTLRPNWQTAVHEIVSQTDYSFGVNTTVFGGLGGEMPTAIFRFVFFDGKIENGIGRWTEWPDAPQHNPNEFHGIDPIAELEGAWVNPEGYTLNFPMPNTTVGDITRMPNGAFVIQLIWNGGGDSRVWVFPAGVEMIRYHWGWERMPYNPYVASDVSAWRLFNGDFEVTSCCADEDINATLFFRRREE